MGLDGRAALVTGGGTGIGRAVSLALARAGCDVAVNYSQSEREAEDTAAAIRESGRQAIAVRADVSRDTDVRQMVASVVKRLGGLDILVNNAGTTRYRPPGDLDAITDEDWDVILGVNLRGPFYCVRAALPHLRRSGRGKVVNTASNSAFRPTGSSIPYMTSKAALVMLTKTLARQLAPDVQVNAIAPGWIETRWVDRFVPPEARKQIFSSLTPPALDDLAGAVVFLASNDSISGETLTVDRGHNL